MNASFKKWRYLLEDIHANFCKSDASFGGGAWWSERRAMVGISCRCCYWIRRINTLFYIEPFNIYFILFTYAEMSCFSLIFSKWNITKKSKKTLLSWTYFSHVRKKSPLCTRGSWISGIIFVQNHHFDPKNDSKNHPKHFNQTKSWTFWKTKKSYLPLGKWTPGDWSDRG